MWTLATFFLRTQIGRVVALSLAVSVAVWIGWYFVAEKYRAEGRSDVLQQQQDATRAAARDADEGERRVRDCYRSGGVWSQAERKCQPK